MKKSKLIVPAALAVMLLSTAASVTGTVAWFTANRAVEIGAGKFEVTSTDGSLAVTLADGNCTTADNTAGAQKITVCLCNFKSCCLNINCSICSEPCYGTSNGSSCA